MQPYYFKDLFSSYQALQKRERDAEIAAADEYDRDIEAMGRAFMSSVSKALDELKAEAKAAAADGSKETVVKLDQPQTLDHTMRTGNFGQYPCKQTYTVDGTQFEIVAYPKKKLLCFIAPYYRGERRDLAVGSLQFHGICDTSVRKGIRDAFEFGMLDREFKPEDSEPFNQLPVWELKSAL